MIAPNPFVEWSTRCEGNSGPWKSRLLYHRFKSMLDDALAAPDRWTYSDLAIAPPKADEFETLDLYQATSGGVAALARMRRDEAIRSGSLRAAQLEPPGAVE